MVRAAADGVIDYATCDPYDRWWWARHRVLLEELNDRGAIELHKAESRHWASLLAISGISAEAATTIQEHSVRSLNALTLRLMPWLEGKINKTEKPVTPEEIHAAYTAEHGLPGSPEYDAMVKHNLALLANTA